MRGYAGKNAGQANCTGTPYEIYKKSNKLVRRDTEGLHTIPFFGTRVYPGNNAGHEWEARRFRSRTNPADIAGRDPGWLPHYRSPAGRTTARVNH